MTADYDEIVHDFHNDLVSENYSRFGNVEVSSAGMSYFDSAIEDGMLPLIDYAKANNITLDRFVSIAMNLGIKNGLEIGHI
jgi:hypothetical protein